MSVTGFRMTGDSALDQIAKDMEGAFKARDAARLASMYTDDAILMPPSQGVVKGRAAIETWLREPMGRVASVKIVPIQTSVFGDEAYQAGTFQTTAEGDESAEQTSFKYVLILKRVWAQWLINFDIWNSNQPPKNSAE